MTVLQIAVLAAVAIGGGAVVLAPDPLRQVIVLGVYGLSLTLLFFVFQDPDVALSEIVVSTVGLPVMVLIALRKVSEQGREREPGRSSTAGGRAGASGPGAGGSAEEPHS